MTLVPSSVYISSRRQHTTFDCDWSSDVCSSDLTGLCVTSVSGGEIVVPGSRDEAIAAFGDGEDVTVLAGGTILMPELNYGRIRPARTILLHDRKSVV